MEFRSDKMWDNYVKFELEHKNPIQAYAVFGRALKVPTQVPLPSPLCTTHYSALIRLLKINFKRCFVGAFEHCNRRTPVKLGCNDTYILHIKKSLVLMSSILKTINFWVTSHFK